MIRKNLFALVAFLSVCTFLHAQDKFYTKTGKISFVSRAPLEDIEAKNKTAAAILDSKTGTIQFSVLMKGFDFQKALMQEHFNENYVESDKYPKAEFKGLIVNNSAINYGKEGSYTAKVKGQLTMHGETRVVEVPATLQVSKGTIDASTNFTIKLSDYKIAIPAVVKDKVSNMVKISVDTKLEALKG